MLRTVQTNMAALAIKLVIMGTPKHALNCSLSNQPAYILQVTDLYSKFDVSAWELLPIIPNCSTEKHFPQSQPQYKMVAGLPHPQERFGSGGQSTHTVLLLHKNRQSKSQLQS